MIAPRGGDGPHFLGRRPDVDRPTGRVLPRQTTIGDLGANTRRGEEGRDARPAHAHSLGQGALRRQLHLQLPEEILAGELSVLAHIRGDDPTQPASGQQRAQPGVLNTGVVRKDLQIVGVTAQYSVEQHRGDATQAEPTYRDRRSRHDVGDRLLRRRNGLVHSSLLRGLADG
jgi:hypothetical protein